MRLNNLSARLICNRKLVDWGMRPLDGGLSYIEFATELRKIVGRKVIQESFVSREDAVRYIRTIAIQNWQHMEDSYSCSQGDSDLFRR